MRPGQVAATVTAEPEVKRCGRPTWHAAHGWQEVVQDGRRWVTVLRWCDGRPLDDDQEDS